MKAMALDRSAYNRSIPNVRAVDTRRLLFWIRKLCPRSYLSQDTAKTPKSLMEQGFSRLQKTAILYEVI